MNKFASLIIVICLTIAASATSAQTLRRVNVAPDEIADVTASDTTDQTRLHGSVGLGMGYLSGWGMSTAYNSVGANLSYDLNDRLTIGGGIGIARGFGEEAIHLHGSRERSLAPRTARGLSSLHAEGNYRVNDRLTVAASVFYAQGNMMPFISPDGRDGYLFGASAMIDYKLGKDSFLSLYIEYMRSERLPLLGYPYWYGSYGSHLMWDTPFVMY